MSSNGGAAGSTHPCGTLGSARHRGPGGPVAPSEVALAGPRVVWPEPGSRIVALRDHDARYTALKAGYHGGATLAEFTIPLLALLPFGAEPPKEWRELGDPAPLWWSDETGIETESGAEAVTSSLAAAAVATPSRPGAKQSKKATAPLAEGVIGLFGEEALTPPASQKPADPAPKPEAPSPRPSPRRRARGTSRRHRAVRGATGPARPEAPGTVRPAQGAGRPRRSGHPAHDRPGRTRGPARQPRPGFAATLAQLLNYDGAQILEILPDNRTLRLHRSQLIEQFGLRAP